jgi:CBS-domain-containing membrane protein
MVGSGAVGGVFTPTLFLGALLGDSFGSILHQLLPGLTADPKAYALVGMGSLLAGTTHAPLTAVLMTFEMSLDYSLILPLLLASAAASIVARAISRESVYTEALSRKRGVLPGEATSMRRLAVRDVMRSDQVTVPAGLPLPQLLDRFLSSLRRNLYVVTETGSLVGVIGIHDVTRALREREDPSTLMAGDLANTHFQVATPDERLDRVIERFWAAESGRLPVLENRDSRKLIGTISQRDILGVYSLEALHRRSPLARVGSESVKDQAPGSVELPADYPIEDLPAPATIIGKSLAEVQFRDRYGLTLLLIRRPIGANRETKLIPDRNTQLAAGDRLIVFGPRERLEALRRETKQISPR